MYHISQNVFNRGLWLKFQQCDSTIRLKKVQSVCPFWWDESKWNFMFSCLYVCQVGHCSRRPHLNEAPGLITGVQQAPRPKHIWASITPLSSTQATSTWRLVGGFRLSLCSSLLVGHVGVRGGQRCGIVNHWRRWQWRVWGASHHPPAASGPGACNAPLGACFFDRTARRGRVCPSGHWSPGNM